MAHIFLEEPVIVRSKSIDLPISFYDRLIAFYQLQPDPVLSQIWTSLNGYTENLRAPLKSGNRQQLISVLSILYDQTLLGGAEFPNYTAPDIYIQKWKTILIQAANALGVLPFINPNQHSPQAIRLDGLVKAMECVLSMKITHRGGGSMHGIQIEERFIPFKLLEAICSVTPLRSIVKRSRVLEIGAGAGFCGYVLLNAGWAEFYDIIDTPIMSVMAAYLLAGIFGPERIWFANEAINEGAIIRMLGANLSIVGKYDVAFNQDSFPEIPEEIADQYLKTIEHSLMRGGVFLSINQESEQGNQKRVFGIIQKCQQLKQIQRVPFWGREGYLQEMWVKI